MPHPLPPAIAEKQVQTRGDKLLPEAVVVAELADHNAGLSEQPFLGDASQGRCTYSLCLLARGPNLRIRRSHYIIEDRYKTC